MLAECVKLYFSSFVYLMNYLLKTFNKLSSVDTHWSPLGLVVEPLKDNKFVEYMSGSDQVIKRHIETYA